MVQETGKIRLKVADSEENRQKCYCRLCPSFPHDCNGEILFCGQNASSCEIKPEGCLCNKCPVYKEYGLKGLYYCDKVASGESKTLIRKKYADEDHSFHKQMIEIKDQSFRGESVVGSMGSPKKLPVSLDDLHFLPAQVNQIPLNHEDDVNTTVTIGACAKNPLKVTSPLIISGMSFGAVSGNVRMVIAQTALKNKIAFNSGEGGIIDEEKGMGGEYRIVQYATGRFGVSEDILKQSAAIEIRFGQGAYPGKGSYLPASKITDEIVNARNLKPGEASYSPAHHEDMVDLEGIKNKVSWLRKISSGVPIGAKIGCGNVEDDVRALVKAGVDFIALDGFGGGTGATDLYVRDNVGIPVFAAIPRARKALEELGVRESVSIIAGGGLRNSADFAKCLALGADAIYIGTSALIAINCQQYRICYTGLCPTGVATQDPKLIEQLDVNEGVSNLTNYLKVSLNEIANLTRITGKNDIKKLNYDDLVAINRDMARLTGVKWINGEKIT